MKRLIWPLAVLAIALNSCGIADVVTGMMIDSRTRPFSEAEASLRIRLVAISNVASELGWPGLSVPGGVLQAGQDALGYLTLESADGRDPALTPSWTIADRDKSIATAVAKNHLSLAVPLQHFRPWLDKNAPLPPRAVDWNDAQLAEWLVWEGAAQRLGTESAEKLAKVAFIGYKFTEALLIRMKGPGSPELARWREQTRDRQTFALLASDLRSQVQGIITAQKDLNERQKALNRVVTNWLNNYHQQYPNRFLTNDFDSFGASGEVSPLELEAIGLTSPLWKTSGDGSPIADAPALWKMVE